MEDDKIKSLFNNFEPGLNSNVEFMERLNRSLNSVEIVKRQNAEFKARSKRAMVIAGCVGFIMGYIFSLSLPYLKAIVEAWQSTMSSDSILYTITDYYNIFAWTLIVTTVSLVTVNSYNVLSSLFTRRNTAP